jgi:uncharacterized protein YdeI (YjbR/CyaY-like superfamily)
VVAHRDRERVHCETGTQWRGWLDEHHENTDGVWLISWKTATGKPRMSYEESVVEALAVGWVDSMGLTIDDERSMLWFARRKPTSGWSRPNKQRVERLEAAGRMGPAGRRAIEVAKANGSWTLLDDVEDLVVPDDLTAALAALPGAAAHWEAFPPSARRAILQWIAQAKTAPTRARRVTETAEQASVGKRANQWPRAST